MDIGRLKHKITFQELSQNKNEYGELEGTWNDIKTVWAEVKPVTGRSFFSAQQVNSEITHQVIIRYTKGIQPKQRIQFKDRVFEILYVMNFNESNEALQIMCKELM